MRGRVGREFVTLSTFICLLFKIIAKKYNPYIVKPSPALE
ncbi:MAG: hypothetical protein OFPI_16190 [Osedax symbiont Rs2]|nr:MAG: hypothetical protein OFPI_16190 [Osedax symbiont Rs2]